MAVHLSLYSAHVVQATSCKAYAALTDLPNVYTPRYTMPPLQCSDARLTVDHFRALRVVPTSPSTLMFDCNQYSLIANNANAAATTLLSTTPTPFSTFTHFVYVSGRLRTYRRHADRPPR